MKVSLSSETSSIIPLPSTRINAGGESIALPRATERYALPEAGLTAMSATMILSGVVPRTSAILSFNPSTLIGENTPAPERSPVSTAKMAAPWVSARKRTPSGPNVMGPAVFQSGAPLTGSFAHDGRAASERANATAMLGAILMILPPGCAGHRRGDRAAFPYSVQASL